MLKKIREYVKVQQKQLLRFISSGMLTTCIFFALFKLLYGILHWDYKWASFIVYGITSCCHFMLQRVLTFGASAQSVVTNGWRYLLMLTVNYGTLLGLTWAMVTGLEASPYMGLLCATAFNVGVNFFIMKYFVFAAAL